MTDIAKGSHKTYFSRPNGKSYYIIDCECGTSMKVYAWRGCKKCPTCGKIVDVTYSFRTD